LFVLLLFKKKKKKERKEKVINGDNIIASVGRLPLIGNVVSGGSGNIILDSG